MASAARSSRPRQCCIPAFVPPESDYRVNLGPANVFFDEGPNAANVQRQINIVNAVLLTKGQHQVKFGHRLPAAAADLRPGGLRAGRTRSTGSPGALAGTASLLTAASSTHNRSSHATNFSTYAQDAWSPTCVADAHLRPPLGDQSAAGPERQQRGVDAHDRRSRAPSRSRPQARRCTAPPTTTSRRELGAAYRLRDTPGREMVLRGGWGIFFDLASPAVMNNLSQTFPFTARRSFNNVPFPADPDLLAPPTVAPGAPADFLVAADPDLKLPYTYEWNVAVEQALGTIEHRDRVVRRRVGPAAAHAGTAVQPVAAVPDRDPRDQPRTFALRRRCRSSTLAGCRGACRRLRRTRLAQSKDNISTDAVAGAAVVQERSRPGLGTVGFRCAPHRQRRPHLRSFRHGARTQCGGRSQAAGRWMPCSPPVPRFPSTW